MWHQWPRLFALNTAILFVFAHLLAWTGYGDLIWQSRNFFGVSRIFNEKNIKAHFYVDGGTLHGAQLTTGDTTKGAYTYYFPLAMLTVAFNQQQKMSNIAIMGLGTGTLSCIFKDNKVTYFEINPAVVSIAKNPALFNYLEKCPPTGGIVLGDARLGMTNMPRQSYFAIVIDVFTSDAIPIHLMTLEAVQIYLSKLERNGLLIFHVSNNHVDLEPQLNALAQKLNIQMLSYIDVPHDNLSFASKWVVLTNNQSIIQLLKKPLNWHNMVADKTTAVWTDDFSNIVRTMI
jgi:spermidine synthase